MFRLLQKLKRLIRVKLKLTRSRSAWAGESPKWGLKIAFLFLITVLITAIYPIRHSFLPISVPKLGDIATEDVVAPIDFHVEKSSEVLMEEKRKAEEEAPLVLSFNSSRYDSIVSRLDSLFSAAVSFNNNNANPSNNATRLRLFFPEFDQTILRRLLSIDSLNNYRSRMRSAVSELYYAGVFDDDGSTRSTDYENVIIDKPGGRTSLKRDQIVTTEKVRETITRLFDQSDSLNMILSEIIAVSARPTLTIDDRQTENERVLAIDRIPRVEISFKAGDVLLRRSQKVESIHLKWLNALAEQRVKTNEKTSWWKFILPVLSRSAFIGFILGVFAAFLFYFKRRESFPNIRFIAILLLILFQVILNYVIGYKLNISFYLIPFAITSLMFAILFDLEIGLMATLTLALLSGILNNFDFSYTFVNFAVGSVACFSVRIVRRRSDFYRSILYISISYLAVIYLLEYLKFTETNQMMVEFGYGILNSVLTPILVMGFLPFFESIFNLSTDITLLELSDMNHPLLRRLAIEAPGTYHHSIVVGNLSEKAAEAIGANSLLARVGAYYHDIGKMEIAEYFVENQSGIRNKHEKLVPSMSALIISSHVKKGVELAEQFDLPDRIIDFIEEHHGTTLMSFFYNKAKEGDEETELNEDNFRYAGPQPNSRETAIVMLADSVEAASRALEDPKPSRIRNVIKRIINDKFQGEQLSHSALTMHDLGLIEESFANMLIGVFHGRIDYPQKEEIE